VPGGEALVNASTGIPVDPGLELNALPTIVIEGVAALVEAL
jgi:hypothetical protein